jgi:hypothetical protein
LGVTKNQDIDFKAFEPIKAGIEKSKDVQFFSRTLTQIISKVFNVHLQLKAIDAFVLNIVLHTYSTDMITRAAMVQL